MIKNTKKILLSFKFIIALILLLSIGFINASADNFTAVQDGDWNDPNTWGSTSFPNSSSDSVAIMSFSVSINSADAVANNITIGDNGSLTFTTANTLTVYGNLNVQGTLNALNSSGITLKGNFTNNGTLSNFSSLDLTIDGDSPNTFTLPKEISTLNSLTLNRTDVDGKFTIDTNLTVANNIVITSGELFCSHNNLTISGNLTVNGNGVFSTDSASVVYLAGNLTYNSSKNSTMDYHSTIDITSSTILQTPGTGKLTLSNMTINAAASFLSSAQFSISGDISNSGSFNAGSSTITFDNDETELYAKTISSTSSMTFSSIEIAEGSSVSNSANIILADNSDFNFTVGKNAYFSCSSGTVTVGMTSYISNLDISVESTGTLEFNNLHIANFALTVSTNSDLTIKSNLLVGTNATFSATNPSTITFANSTTNTNPKQIIGTGTHDKKQFYNLLIDEASAVSTTSSFDIANDFTVSQNGDFRASSSSTISLINSGNKTITNSGVLIFKHLSIPAAGSGENKVRTSSNFTISGQLLVGGTDATPTNGSLIAYDNSKITLSGNSLITPYSSETTGNDALQFQNLAITGTGLTPKKSFKIKGNLDIDGSLAQSSGTITLSGSTQQVISGTTASFTTLIIDNIAGTKLLTDLLFTDYLTLTNGDLDLNGSHTITMANTSSKLIESTGASIINSSPGVGGISSGYIASQQIASKANVSASGLGISIANGNSSNITVRRYHSPRTIDSMKSIKRYYRLDYSGANLGDVTISYDNDELNGNSPTALYLYYSADENSSTWTRTSSTVTSTTGINSGTITISGLTGLGSPIYLAVATLQTQIKNLPYSGIDSLNKIASSPLTAGMQDSIVLAFDLYTPVAINQIDSLKISINSSTFTNQFENFLFKYDSDQNLSTYGLTSTSASISNTNDTITIKGISPTTLSTGDNYFFLLADVSSTVTQSSATVGFSLTNDNIFLSSAETNDITITSPSYSFTELLVTADVSNTPSGSLTNSATLSKQPIYGFTLTPVASSPTCTFTSVKISFTSSSYTHFSDILLYQDVNKNRVYDGSDINLGSSGTITTSTDTITYSGFSHTFSNSEEFIVTAIISSSAQTYTNIQGFIYDDSWISLTSSATLSPLSSTLSGNVMTVASSSTASKLAIKNISLVTPIEDFSANEFVTGKSLSITVEAEDSNGNPQGVLSDTNITFTVAPGSATITNNSTTISQYNSESTINNLALTNADGASDIIITASATSFTSATYTAITLFAEEPSVTPSSLTITNVSQSSASISWSSGTPANHILLIKQGSIPYEPSKGTSYTQATGNSYSTPKDSTNTGSYVIYKGSGTSVNVTGLSASTQYYFSIYNYNGTGSGIRYGLTRTDGDMITIVDTTTLSATPSTQASSLSVSNPQDTSMTLSWTKGDGNKTLILCSLNNPISASIIDGEIYKADSSFGGGSQIGNAYVVYAGTGNSLTVSNLSPSTSGNNNEYYFSAMTFNDNGGFTNYLTSNSSTVSRKTLYNEPEFQASNIQFSVGPSSSSYLSGDNSIKLSWINGGGEGRIVVCSSTLTDSEIPRDASVSYSNTPSVAGASVQYGSTDTLGKGFIIYKGTGETNTVTVTGLTYGQKYYFRVFEYNGSGSTTTNSQINYLTSSADDNPNSKIADKYEPNDSYSELSSWQYVVPDGTEYQGVLTDSSDEDWFYFEPDIYDGYNNIRVVLKNLPFNYELELYNYTGTRLLRRSFRTNKKDEIIVLNNVPRGKYYIRIFTRYYNTSLYPYRFRVDGKSTRLNSHTPY